MIPKLLKTKVLRITVSKKMKGIWSHSTSNVSGGRGEGAGKGVSPIFGHDESLGLEYWNVLNAVNGFNFVLLSSYKKYIQYISYRGNFQQPPMVSKKNIFWNCVKKNGHSSVNKCSCRPFSVGFFFKWIHPSIQFLLLTLARFSLKSCIKTAVDCIFEVRRLSV